MIRLANASDHAAKIIQGYVRHQSMEGCYFAGESFGDAIKLGIRGEMFGWRGSNSEV
jgi:hypothetical protein